ncbi:major histocompatibility complex class I-related gene protein-like [Odontesthes bonariensis]|uniref:major histocompatibility complex class I-related protein 1-like n=1 Tax=Odontesthes bonariensis TaxID=219752 RepID=UPI003F587876
MKLIFLLFLGIHGVTAVTHSLKYFYTASSGVSGFPEYVSVGLVDDVQISHCDSITKRNVPKQDWMTAATAEDPQYWDRNTQTCVGNQQSFKAGVQILKQRFNQTGGIHLYQEMVGCEWDDETGEVKGFNQYGYDGDDLVVFDLKTTSWVAPKQQGVITKHKWDKNKANTDYWISYLSQICPEWLKKYVAYGKSSLQRTELPSVSLLQKSASSPVSCHATGFYPNGADLFWRRDGDEIHEGVVKGEVLPNNDGTFQMSADLKLSDTPEEWGRYECVFQLSGVKDDLITKLEKRRLRGNGSGSDFPVAAVVGVLVGILVLAGVVAGGVFYWKKGNHGFKRTNTSDTSSSSREDPDSKKEDNEKQTMMGANC